MTPRLGTELSRIHRWRATAESWFTKAVRLLVFARSLTRNAQEEWLVGYEAELLLTKVLYEARDLAPLLQADQFATVEGQAERLLRAIRNHRLAFQLEQTNGRTSVEAATFATKAAALRSGA